MCGVTENIRVIDTPSALIESTPVMLGTAGGGMATTLQLRGITNTISIDLLRMIARLFLVAQMPKLSISAEQDW